jgi:hydroxymethylglutaryl-CoA reductase
MGSHHWAEPLRLAGGAGLAEYGTPIVSREGSLIGTQSRLALEVNAGGGLKVPVDDTWGMRSDARWFKSFGRNGGEHFRVAHGISFDVGKR